MWNEWLADEDYLFETIPIFFPFALAEQALMIPIKPLESSNLLEFPICLI